MKNRKLTITLAALLLVFMLLATACSGQTIQEETTTAPEATVTTEATAPTDDASADKLKIGFVTAAGGVGDESLTDMVYGGIVEAVEAIGAEFDYVEPLSASDFTPMFKEYCQDGSYDLIIGVGYECATPIAELSPLYPEQHFLAVDTTVKDAPDNVACIVFNRAEQGFIVGLPTAYLANASSIKLNGADVALPDSGNKIGSIIGTDAQTILESQYGLYAACKYVSPDKEIEVLTGVVGAWTDSAKANEIALSMYSQGISFIWQNAGNGGKGIFSAAKDLGCYSTGWNTDQTSMDPDHILFSVVKSMGKVTGQWIKEYDASRVFAPGVSSYGYATGGYELVYSPNFEPTAEMLDIVNAGLEKLKNGEIVIPLTEEDLSAFTASYKD